MSTENQSPAVDVFAQALAKRNQQKTEQEEAKNNQGSYEYEQVETVGLVRDKEIVGRIMGAPVEVRTLPTDCKLILQSSIVKADKKGYVKITWPMIEKKGKNVPDPEWIVSKLYDTVFKKKWVKFSEGILKDADGKVYPADHKTARQKDGMYVYDHARTKIYEEMDGNTKVGDLYPPKFAPGQRVICNWIDRHDSWCKNNKHSKVLTASKKPYEKIATDGTKTTIYFSDTGIPGGLYDKIFEYSQAVGTMDNDLVITKIEKDYKVFDSTDTKFITPESAKLGVKTKISEEEKSYALYDLDKLYAVSSYSKIKKHLSPLFKLCDAELNTNFMTELEELCKIEEAERKAKKDEVSVYYINPESGAYGITTTEDLHELIESDENVMEVTKEQHDQFVAQEVKLNPEVATTQLVDATPEEPKVQTAPRRGASVETSKVIEDQCKANFPNWEKLSDEDKKFMFEFIVKFDGNVPVYKDNTPLGCADETCVFPGTDRMTIVPVEVHTCPVCGRFLE